MTAIQAINLLFAAALVLQIGLSQWAKGGGHGH